MSHPIYGKFPFATMNRWIGDDLATQNLMPKTVKAQDGKMYPTIIPGGEKPEQADSIATNPSLRSEVYILYGVDNDEAVMLPYKKCEAITYAILGPTVQRVAQVLYCIYDLTSRHDWSVDDLNYSDANSPFEFISMTFEEITGFEPVKQEGGRYAAIASIHYEYVFKSINGAPGTTGVGRRV